ncbi:MAG: serine hydrolase [Candidatus Amulumruptor caecigallinarius]|nr:serine hydrolase [Candidatus Amulumruptor caecigallinarius]MCM1396322.1 serine hydrolase [Candidatus Amulumruptor caecigallinarius]MCM1453736.1 serine hydrolase [bacterium]
MNRKLISLAASLAILLLCSLTVAGGKAADPVTPRDKARMEAAYAWADSVMVTLDLRHRVAQLVFPRLDIKNDAAGRATIDRMVGNLGVGGFLLGKGTLADYKGLIDYARTKAKVPLMVTLDGEWGLAMRVTDAPRFPHNMALGAAADPAVVEQYGREVARECRLVGINVNFAPVLDVNSNPSNPVIGYRSFGEDPAKVAELGAAYSRGLEAGGVMSVAKHFPGHGDTDTDSHKALPRINRSAAEIDKVELVPFRRYISGGFSGVMVGHLDIPALDPTGAPASLSQPIVTGLLKGKMGFDGLVWTDALAMKGAGSKENNCVRALKAGVDVLLQPESPVHDVDQVLAAIKKGTITEQTINERCRKLLAYKYLFVVNPVGVMPVAASAYIVKAVNSPQAESVNQTLADACVTVIEDDHRILPLRDLQERSIAVVSLGAPAQNMFSNTCNKYAACALYGAPEGTLTDAQLHKIEDANTIIVGVFKQSAAVLSSLRKLTRDDAEIVAVSFVNPYKMARLRDGLDDVDALVGLFDDTPSLRRAGAEALFGGVAATGRLPVNLSGWLKAGTGVDTPKTRLGFSTPGAVGLPSDLSSRYDSIIRAAMADGAFPGCQVLVAKDGEIVIDKSYGSLNPRGSAPVTDATLYDIASVSKIAGVVSGLMRAYDEGKWQPTDTIGRFIPELAGTPKGSITMRQLLLHQSGMPAMISMYDVLLDTATYTGSAVKGRPGGDYTVKLAKNAYANRNARLRTDLVSPRATAALPTPVGEGVFVGQATFDTICRRIFNVPLRPAEYRYSDLNFVLLMLALEQMEGRRLDELVETDVFAPIGADRTMYIPLQKGVQADAIAPTERDPFLRKQLVRGYAHDELAAFSGGIQGNAGLFSTADDLAKLAQTWLNGGTYGGSRVFSPEVVKLFTSTRSADGKRSLGFDTAMPRSGAGSPRSYGHTGFTGTQLKVDPDNGLIFIFLSNRVNPTRDNDAFTRSDIRGRLWSELYK